MEVIAVINRKGGVGKTATVHALGAGLIRRGYKVLFIDLDSQTNLSKGLGASLANYSSLDILRGDFKTEDAIQHLQAGDVIPGTEALAGVDQIIGAPTREKRLKEAIKGLQYDYIIIDTPAQLGTLTINALTASNSVIIPVQADIDSLDGIGQLSRAIDTVKKRCNDTLYIRGILLTRYYARAVLSQDMQENLKEIAEQLHTKLYATPIRECIAVKEAKAYKQDIFTYAPRSNAAIDYEAFIEEFIQEGSANN